VIRHNQAGGAALLKILVKASLLQAYFTGSNMKSKQRGVGLCLQTKVWGSTQGFG